MYGFSKFSILTEQGYEFGKLLASQILGKFVTDHGKNPSTLNSQKYQNEFTSKIPEVFRSCINPILDKCKCHFCLWYKYY